MTCIAWIALTAGVLICLEKTSRRLSILVVSMTMIVLQMWHAYVLSEGNFKAIASQENWRYHPMQIESKPAATHLFSTPSPHIMPLLNERIPRTPGCKAAGISVPGLHESLEAPKWVRQNKNLPVHVCTWWSGKKTNF